jgi:microsomal dipeptidase-like Zn-dependent dipeptidase
MPPVFDPSQRPNLDLAHLTSVRINSRPNNFYAALAVQQAFRKAALSNTDTHEVLDCQGLEKPGLRIIFGMQYTPGDMTSVRMNILYKEGVRIISIGNSHEYVAHEEGLTARGYETIEYMAENGMILDLSYAKHQAARDALHFIQREHLLVKVAATYTGCYHCKPLSCNLPDDVLRDIADLGGYVGISFLREHKIDSLCHAMKTVGIDNVGIGINSPNKELVSIVRKDINSRFSQITTEGLCGKNFRNFLRRSLPGRA